MLRPSHQGVVGLNTKIPFRGTDQSAIKPNRTNPYGFCILKFGLPTSPNFKYPQGEMVFATERLKLKLLMSRTALLSAPFTDDLLSRLNFSTNASSCECNPWSLGRCHKNHSHTMSFRQNLFRRRNANKTSATTKGSGNIAYKHA
jgi:hypothetical protein